MSRFQTAISGAFFAAEVSAARAAAAMRSTIEHSFHFSVPAFALDLAWRSRGLGGEPRMNRFVALMSLAMLVGGCASGTAVSSQSSPTPGASAIATATTVEPSGTPLPSDATPSGTLAGPSASPIGVALPAELIGSWSVLLGQDDVAAIASHIPGFNSVGVWTLTLSANTFQMFNPDNFTAGPVAAGIDAGKHLLVANDPDCLGQVAQTGGAYTYLESATSLTFSPVGDDACPFRPWLLRAKPWKKAP